MAVLGRNEISSYIERRTSQLFTILKSSPNKTNEQYVAIKTELEILNLLRQIIND